MPRLVLGSLALMVLLGNPVPAAAQASVADVLSFLVTNISVDTGNQERDAAAAASTAATISNALLANLATLPVTSTSGAFLYRLNRDLGTVERAAGNFGPVLVQRALTLGHANAGIGATLQHLRFTSLDGRSLRDGTLVTTANQFGDEPEPYDTDRLTLRMDADVVTVYGSLGLGERVEIGAAAPVVWLRVEGARVNTYRGRTFTQATAAATVVGLADVLVRAKVKAFEDRGVSLGAAVDTRLPTGRQGDLLGTGRAAVRVSAIGSLERPGFSAHANAGVSVGGLASEVSYGVALAVAAAPRLTVSAEAFGRSIDAPGGIATSAAPHPRLAGVQTLRLVPSGTRFQTATIAPGVRWNVTDTWVVTTSIGVPLLKAGLRAPLTVFAGVDLALTR